MRGLRPAQPSASVESAKHDGCRVKPGNDDDASIRNHQALVSVVNEAIRDHRFWIASPSARNDTHGTWQQSGGVISCIYKEKVIYRQLYLLRPRGARSFSVRRDRSKKRGVRAMRTPHVRKIVLGCLSAALVVMLSPGTGKAQSALNPGFKAGEEKLTPSVRGRTRDLVLRDRVQRPLLDLFVSATDRRGDRLVPNPRGQEQARPVPGLGRDSRSRIAAFRATPIARRRRLEETYGFQWCPGDDGASEVRRQGRLSRPRLRLQRRAIQHRHAAWHGRSAPETPATCCSGPRPARSGLRKFPNPRFDAEKWRKLNGSLATWEELQQVPVRRDRATATRAPTGCSTARSSRRSASACRAAPATSRTIRSSRPPIPNKPRMGEHRRAGRQPVQPDLADSRLRHVAARSLEWQLIARSTAGHGRHLGAADGHGRQPRHHERHQQFRPAAAARASGAEMAQDVELPRRGRRDLLVRARQARQMLAAQRDATRACSTSSRAARTTIGAEEAIQRVYFNIGSCAEQCWLNHVPDLRAARSGATQLRADAVRHRPVPPRLRELPRHRGPARRPRRVLPGARARRSVAGARIGKPQELDRAARSGVRRGLGRARPAGFAGTCAGCHSSQSGLTPKPTSTPRCPAIRRCGVDFLSNEKPLLGEPGRHLSRRARCTPTTWRAGCGTNTRRATLQDRPADPAPQGSAEGRRPRLLPAALAAQRLGLRAVHAQQRDRARSCAASRAIRRSTSTRRPMWTRTASRSPTRRPACRSTPSVERALRAVQGLDGGAAQSGQAHSEGHGRRMRTSSSTSRRKP